MMDSQRRESGRSRSGASNPAFEADPVPKTNEKTVRSTEIIQVEKQEAPPDRDTWGNPIEFLLSCISMSVGLGNVWRFPSTAFKNGGGAFLIPYVIVLLFIGKPLYFLEMILGQFSSRGSVKVWAVTPIVKGIGYGQAMSTWFVVTYYCCLMALTTFYFFASFASVLPWTVCDESWAEDNCFSAVDAAAGLNATLFSYNATDALSNATDWVLNSTDVMTNWTDKVSSAEQYLYNAVLKKSFNIDDGVGVPDWQLVLCLLFSWLAICLILIKGIASSGKVAYFTAIFPYVVLFTLLIRGVTLDGASTGILYFIKPQWEKLFLPEVWYAAVTQCFFSLSVGFGPVIMFSSFNPFRHNIYRDALIVSLMDTFTSILAGVTIFSILGNLAYESGKEIDTVVTAGVGLAFISYPETIARFDVVPQLFAVLFFLMLFTLGVGSAASLSGCVITVVCDALPQYKRWQITCVICAVGFLLGLVYVTPGGQYILEVVDAFGGGFIIYVMAIIETVAISWIYGLRRFLKDVEFMLDIRLSRYWQFSWGLFIPISLLGIFFYSLFQFPTFQEGDYIFPMSLVGSGWVLAVAALLQIPCWAAYVVYHQKRGTTLMQRFWNSFQPSDSWGPKDPKLRADWISFVQNTPDVQFIPQPIKKAFNAVCPRMLRSKLGCLKSKKVTNSKNHVGSSAEFHSYSNSSQTNLSTSKVEDNPI